MGELAALRLSGCSRGVDDGGDVVQSGDEAPFLERGVVNAGSGFPQRVEAAAVELPDIPEPLEVLCRAGLANNVLVAP